MTLCRRCGFILEAGRPKELTKPLALYLSALILFVLANIYPLLVLRIHGTIREASIPYCARFLTTLGWPWLSTVLITTVIVAPLVHILGTMLVIVQVQRGRQNEWTSRIFRVVQEFRDWSMAEVFVLGLLISYVKLAQWATVVPGPSLYALGAFMVMATAAVSSLDPQALWNQLKAPPPLPDIPEGARTARRAGLVACPTCKLVSPLEGAVRCPRCSASLHSRKLNSQQRTWALMATAAVLYVPANLLTMMRTVKVGNPTDDTIISGIFHLARTGSFPLAVIVFIASIFVPVLKLVILTLLLLTERAGSTWRPRRRTWLYRLTETVGRWSMLDIFVVILMVAMVEETGVTTVAPGPAAVAFALMVVTTILAVRCFDPRLVWDALEPDNG